MSEDIIVAKSGMKCTEITQATISHMAGRGYELMFCDSWGFSFINDKKIIEDHIIIKEQQNIIEQYYDTIAVRTSSGYSNFSENLEKYYGIETTVLTNIKSCDIKPIVFNAFRANSYIGMWFDQYYMPWAKEIRKEAPLRYDGFLLLLGYDSIHKEILCLDIHGSRNMEKLPIKSFYEYINSIQYQNLMIYRVSNEKSQYLLSDVLNHIYDRFNHDINNGIFNQMNQFAVFLNEKFDFQREIELSLLNIDKLSAPTHIEGIKVISDISRKRNLFSLCLEYIGLMSGNDSIGFLADKFKLLAGYWQMIVSFLVKSFYKNDITNINSKLYNQAMICIEYEEKICNCLLNTLSSKIIYNEHINKITKQDFIYEMIQIEQYYNNKAFANSVSNNEKANFDGLGNFLLMPLTKKIISREYFIEINQSKFDNISCNNQVINILKNYQGILIIGACDSGAYYGNFRIKYDNNTFEDKVVGFGEWRFDKCEFNEELIWKGKRVDYRDSSKDTLGYIFKQIIFCNKRNKLTNITLPENRYIHIWGMIGLR